MKHSDKQPEKQLEKTPKKLAVAQDLNSSAADGSWATEILTSETWTATAYHELADVPVQKFDLLEDMQKNLNSLAELQFRMKFMMNEIKYLMKVES